MSTSALDKIKSRRKIQRKISEKLKITFLRNLWWKFPKFKNNPKWVKPKGNDSKLRLKLKGYPPVVQVGYRTSRDIRYLHPSGYKPVIVTNIRDLDNLNPSEHIIYLSSRLGGRKRVAIINEARSRGFKIANEVV